MSVVALPLLAAGTLILLTGAVGVIRLPDFYTRLHVLGKNDTLGMALVALGIAALEGFVLESGKILLILLFVALANPTATHALGRAAYRAGLKPWRRSPE